MATKFKFIHTADIHLGSILHISRKTDREELNDLFLNAVYYTFTAICDTAIINQVDFIVISGDLYDKESRSVKANRFFINECLRLKENNIQVFVIHGNHDPYKKENEILSLPDNVHIFSSEKSQFIDAANKTGEIITRLAGQSYRSSAESRAMHNSYTEFRSELFNIGLLHTQLELNNYNYVPCSINELKSNKNINYWALGHIHKASILNDKEPVIAYPGIPQGRDFGEEGAGGVFLVEVNEDHEANIKFVKTSKVIWKKITFQIDENKESIPKNLSELEQFLIDKASAFVNEMNSRAENISSEGMETEGYIVQWIITGRGIIHKLLVEREEEIINVLIKGLNDELAYKTPFVWTDSIVIRTSPEIENLESIKEQNGVFKEIEEFTKQCMEKSELKKQIIDTIGDIWEYSLDYENIDDQKFLLDDRFLEEILEAAKQLAIEKLLDGSIDQ